MSGEHDQDERYKSAIRALAGSTTILPSSAARIERELLRAFTEYHSEPRPGGVRAPARGRWRPWLAAAAAAAVVAVSVGRLRDVHRVTENNVTAGSTTRAGSLPSVGGHAPVVPAAGTSSTVPARPASSTARARLASKRPVPRVLRPAGFVLIPGTAGLPQFESGTIMRVELPVASLPAYGVDISPAADDQPVEADVLVGQDGQARAIRLVPHSSRSSQ